MNVKLISITQPIVQELKDLSATPEDLIVYTARVSNPSNQLNTETAPKLIRYLINNKHWSPFEMVDMTVEIKTSRAIAQQILRHRSFSFQEFSQRYSDVTEFEPIQLRKKAESNRQSSAEEFDPIIHKLGGNDGDGFVGKANWLVEEHLKRSEEIYKMLLDVGVAREVARLILPLSTQTTIYMKGSIRSWIHYLEIRTDEHTQLEHRWVAERIRDIFTENFPNISEALYAQGTKG